MRRGCCPRLKYHHLVIWTHLTHWWPVNNNNKSPLHNVNNVKDNCDINKLPEGSFTLSIKTILSNGMNLEYMPDNSAQISKLFTGGGRNLFNL